MCGDSGGAGDGRHLLGDGDDWAGAYWATPAHRLTRPALPAVAAPAPNSGSQERDLSKVRHKLRKFLLRRPTLQSLREKGYIRGTGGTGRARRLWALGCAALMGLSPRPGVRLRAGPAV